MLSHQYHTKKKYKEHLLPTVDRKIVDVLRSIKPEVLHGMTFGAAVVVLGKHSRDSWEFWVKPIFPSEVGTLLLITVALGGHQLTAALIHANLSLSGAFGVNW